MQGNTEWLNIHLLWLLVSQAEVTVNTSPGADLPMPSMRTTRCRNPHQEVSCHCALLKWYPVIRADCRKLTQEFVTFPGVEQVHSYLGIPVPHSETNTGLAWDYARLTCWTSHLALDSHSFLQGKKKKKKWNHTTVMLGLIQKYTEWKASPVWISLCKVILINITTETLTSCSTFDISFMFSTNMKSFPPFTL